MRETPGNKLAFVIELGYTGGDSQLQSIFLAYLSSLCSTDKKHLNRLHLKFATLMQSNRAIPVTHSGGFMSHKLVVTSKSNVYFFLYSLLPTRVTFTDKLFSCSIQL